MSITLSKSEINCHAINNKGRCQPPRWKMAVLSWMAVWPVSMLMRAILKPVLGPNFPQILAAGLIAAGIVVILYWVVMPLLVKVAHNWLYPKKCLEWLTNVGSRL